MAEHPYRTNSFVPQPAAQVKPVPIREHTFPDATPEEIAFWEKVYAAVASANDCKDMNIPRSWANQALHNRRASFPTVSSKKDG